jgi:tRNA (guanine-N7-)-methyltransferase
MRRAMSDAHHPMRTYGRIKSRKLKPGRADLMQTLLPELQLDLSGPLDPAALMPGATETWLEIGFGGGEHLAGQAARNPDVLLLGAEPFLNGVASALRHIQEAGVTNVRLHAGDVRELTQALPDASVSRVFILFPDPWPKTRHQKRRLVQEDFVTELARVLKPEGRLRFATDWADYADWTLERILRSQRFVWDAARADDWRTPPADHLTTRYEQKGLGDCKPVFLDFRRL